MKKPRVPGRLSFEAHKKTAHLRTTGQAAAHCRHDNKKARRNRRALQHVATQKPAVGFGPATGPETYLTLRFSAELLPRFSTISYSTCWPSLSVLSPARSTAEMCTNT